jgi:hypothetical protein
MCRVDRKYGLGPSSFLLEVGLKCGSRIEMRSSYRRQRHIQSRTATVGLDYNTVGGWTTLERNPIPGKRRKKTDENKTGEEPRDRQTDDITYSSHKSHACRRMNIHFHQIGDASSRTPSFHKTDLQQRLTMAQIR